VTADAIYTAQYASFHASLGNSFFLGKYPQTVVEDSATLTALETATDSDSDGYLEYGSAEYKKVTAAPNRKDNKSASGNVTFVAKNVYYFKVEPIQWRVLSGKGGTTGLVMAEKILDKNVFYASTSSRTVSGSTINPNNYQYSTLRARLNGYDGSSYSVSNFTGKGFLDIAFSESEKTHITNTNVKNDDTSMGGLDTNNYSCDDTSDKIFPLSYQDLINVNYGFNSSSSEYDEARCSKVTDYGIAKGVAMSSDPDYEGNGYWWSRSPNADNQYKACYICDDSLIFGFSVDYANLGIRPSFNVDID
jgi:hypothetical protein